MSYGIYPLGDRGITFQLSDPPSVENHTHLKKIGTWVEAHAFPGLLDIVLSYQSVTILFDRYIARQSGITDVNRFLTEHLEKANLHATNKGGESQVRVWKIPVCYDPSFGFDLESLAREKNLLAREVIERHAAREYHVYMIGFLPGFPYLGFVDERISISRKQTPLANVPAGSVGIAGMQTGIYPMDSPGGWQIIGRTPERLFDPKRTPPVEIQPGDTVHFFEISIDEFHQRSAHP